MKQAETQPASFALPLPFSLSPPLSILLSKGARARTLSPLLLVLSIYAYVSLFLSLIPALSFPLSLPLSLSLSLTLTALTSGQAGLSDPARRRWPPPDAPPAPAPARAEGAVRCSSSLIREGRGGGQHPPSVTASGRRLSLLMYFIPSPPPPQSTAVLCVCVYEYFIRDGKAVLSVCRARSDNL